MIEAHLEHIRDLERRIAAQAIPTAPGCTKPTLSADAIAQTGTYHTDPQFTSGAQADILIAALRCGLSNVFCMLIGDFTLEWTNPPYSGGGGHDLGHAANDTGRYTDWYATMLANRRYRIAVLAKVLDAMAATPEGTGNMLDNSLLLYTSEFSNAANHSSTDVPVLLAGKAAGQIRTGRHLDYNVKASVSTTAYETKASLHNLHTSILNAFGYPDTHFGTDHAYVRGPLSGLV